MWGRLGRRRADVAANCILACTDRDRHNGEAVGIFCWRDECYIGHFASYGNDARQLVNVRCAPTPLPAEVAVAARRLGRLPVWDVESVVTLDRSAIVLRRERRRLLPLTGEEALFCLVHPLLQGRDSLPGLPKAA